MKRRRWRYLLGAFLLAAGLLTGCVNESGKTVQESQTAETQIVESQAAENQESDSREAGKQGQEVQVAESPDQKGQTAEAKEPGSQTTVGQDQAEKSLESEEQSAGNPAAEESEEPEQEAETEETKPSPEMQLSEDSTYTSKEEVAEYLYLYGHLPDNFITKKEAKALGWVSSEGNLGKVAPGKSIGGDYFGNFEGNLPEKRGREYHECDIDSSGGYRGAKRIVYSNDGLIYYTEDHYETFELLYGEE